LHVFLFCNQSASQMLFSSSYPLSLFALAVPSGDSGTRNGSGIGRNLIRRTLPASHFPITFAICASSSPSSGVVFPKVFLQAARQQQQQQQRPFDDSAVAGRQQQVAEDPLLAKFKALERDRDANR
jgi:hypothetical protein